MNQHLQQFAQQLAIWTQAIIEHGRTPFRRVDTYPDLDTEQGKLQPPLVFWINRQSMMAGGILLLPDNNLEEELVRGRSCASALGLQHFVTWETDRVRIWHTVKDQSKELRSFPLSSSNHPETFRLLLAEILDEMKLLAVLGAIPVKELSPCYFNNLFQTTLQQSLSSLIEAYRSQRSEMEEYSTEDADKCADEANRLLILQVISLLWFNKFPETILPENLERTIELSLPALPDPLRQALAYRTTTTPPLPLETTVCFHHLLLRLHQLSWGQETERAKQSIYHLIHSWYQDKTGNNQPAAIQLYPETPPLSPATTVILSNSPPFLAATALLADIASSGAGYKLYFGNLFQFDREGLPRQAIFGRLLNPIGIKGAERHECTARLRTAWPNRHLKIKAGQPFWFWELIHLLGLSHRGQKLTLELPVDLLKNPENMAAWSLLSENFSFQKFWQLENGNIQISILAAKDQRKPFPLQLATEVREIVPITDANGFRNQLLLALTLPTAIYKLLGTELIWPDPDGVPNEQLPAWELYRHSLLYKWFRDILQYEQVKGEDESEMSTDGQHSNIPYPEPLLLNELNQFASGKTAGDQFSSIDHCLAHLLTCPAVAEINPSTLAQTPKTPTQGSSSKKELKETIAQQLLTHGIPNFPEQYLYFLDQPETCHYTVVPPLKVKSSLLGQFELEDLQGRIIAGYGEDLEQILLFCSDTGKTEFELPADRHQLEQLLLHYRKDLRALYKYLNTLCYSQVETSKSARRLVKNIWKYFNLPDPAWFKN